MKCLITGQEAKDLDKENKHVRVEATMTAGRWEVNPSGGYLYSFESSYPSNKYNVEIELGDSITPEQANSYHLAQLVGSDSANVVFAHGERPDRDIPIVLTIVKVG